MRLGVLSTALVSPIGLDAEEHAFFLGAEVTGHSSGAFVDRDGAALPINECGWIPPGRPWESRLRLLAKQALMRLGGEPTSPLVLVSRPAQVAPDGELVRFLALDGRRVVATSLGAAGFAHALQQASGLAERAQDVVVLAVDSLIRPGEGEQWVDERYSKFTRSPLPPSEGAAAIRLTAAAGAPVVGRIVGVAAGRSAANDDNELPVDRALGRVFAELAMPPRVAVVVGPRDVDLLRHRDFQVASIHHNDRMVAADMPSLEGRVGRLGSAAGLMSLVFGHAWLRHGIAEGARRDDVALAWARSADGAVGAALVEDAP